jgi:hypothetical protein
MRKILLATVAIAPLTIGAAWAQNAQPNNNERPRNVQTPGAQQSPGKSDAAQDNRRNQAQGNAEQDKDKDKSRSAQDDKKDEPNRQAQGRDKDKSDANTGQAQTAPTRNDRSTAQGENSKTDQNATDRAREGGNTGNRPANLGNANDPNQPANRNAASPSPNSNTRDNAQTNDPNRNNADANRTGQDPNRAAQDQNRTGQDQNRTGAAQTGQSTTNVNVNANLNIEPEKRDRVINVLRDNREARTEVNFSISVGATVPTQVRFRPLPREVVEIVPQYRGYEYVVVRNEIVIVEPKTRKIVYVLNNSGAQARTGTKAKFTIASEKRGRIVAEARKAWKGPRDVKVTLRVGEKVPQTVALLDFPDMLVSEEPMLREYDFVVVQDRVAVVDPGSREIVEVLDER